MIIIYKGARGRGKTLTMVKDALAFYLKGHRVLSNIHLKFGEYIENEDILNLDKNSDIFNCVLVIDEIQIFFDSRRGMRKENLSFSNFIQQSRKRNITILTTTQYVNTIDLRLRQHLDILAFPNYIQKSMLCEVTYMDLTRLEDNDFILGSNAEFKPATRKVIFNAQPIFKLYDTREMIV